MAEFQIAESQSDIKRIRTLRQIQMIAVVSDLGAALLFAVVLPATGFQMAPVIQTVVVVSFIAAAVVIYFVVGSLIKKASQR